MRALKWLVTLPLIILLLVFALSNRAAATLNFWPFDLTLALPLSFMLVATLVLGLLLGGFTVWLGDLKHKLEANRLRHEVTALNRRIAELQLAAAPKAMAVTNPAPLLSFKRRFRFPKLEL